MKRWFRPVAYSTILILLAVAIFGRPAVPSASVAALPARVAHRAEAAVRPASRAPVLHVRSEEALAASLFDTAVQTVAEEAPPAVETIAPAPSADLKILGWMQADATPTVFVAYGNENYTLTPTQSVKDVYRFDKIGGGQAVFTYLPTGEARQYAVSDPALSE
ncbi:hypothetical protein RHOFW104T7_15320 [Rhodanobacter thiooxydans]|uniref:Secretion system X translation initiation factor n=1 Tax=Rhodanobacter thiooxydans TaxID=416169 RepID=A0A154QFP3_9GAMM|nr:hypothetical protein [Rhodanobacter thiooxydans]EIL98059.1 hypothetical protein UUA_12815 [Rhodanobacter thiooxydans LCS2]KZC23074.1 hypothetical protein RHOFW104T7_15320 [Rhodanobacter thiooxydans]MCW0203587.1 hypothetical protein [Rhodanobacter thiooxydans]